VGSYEVEEVARCGFLHPHNLIKTCMCVCVCAHKNRNRVFTTPGNTGNLLEFEIPPGNTGNLDFC